MVNAEIEVLKVRDPFLLGIRTFVFVYLCQLNPNMVALKVIYAKAYWMLSFWHLLELGTPLSEDISADTWAAVNIVPEGKKITKRYKTSKSAKNDNKKIKKTYPKTSQSSH